MLFLGGDIELKPPSILKYTGSPRQRALNALVMAFFIQQAEPL
jgi:hypothetical protein